MSLVLAVVEQDSEKFWCTATGAEGSWGGPHAAAALPRVVSRCQGGLRSHETQCGTLTVGSQHGTSAALAVAEGHLPERRISMGMHVASTHGLCQYRLRVGHVRQQCGTLLRF